MNLSMLKNRYSAGTMLALKNINWMLMEKVITVPISLVLNVILARYLGAALFGQYSYYTALVALVVPIAALGLNAIVSREVVQNPGDVPRIMGTALLGRLVGCGLGVIGLVLYASFQSQEQLSIIVYLAFCQVFSAFTVFAFWFQAKQRNQFVVFSRLLALAVGFLIKIGIVLADLGLRYLVLAFGLDFLLVALFMIVYYRRESQSSNLDIEFRYLSGLMSQSKWLIMSSVAATVNLKIDLIMLGDMHTDAEVGLYSVAARMSEVWYFIPVTITAAFFPVLLKAREQDSRDYQRKLQKLNDMLFALSLAIVFPVILVSEFFITLIFGEQYQGSATMLNIHIIGGIFIFMRALVSKWLIAENLLRFSLVSHGLGAILNVACNYLWIPEYGGVGASVASVFSYLTSSYLALFVSSKTRPMAKVMTYSMIYPLRYLGPKNS